MNILIGIGTFILVIVSLFLVLIILMQKAKTDGGMGATLGGGAAEAAFGAETGNVLTSATRTTAIIFFVLAFLLYLGHIYTHSHHRAATALPDIPAPAAPATPAPDTTPAPVPANETAPAQDTAPAATAPAPAS
ncbi:preprotein translocase subunit SecG [Termitidicoccus mucosus]|uniref:Protein-export membrane protein SecG n=1 Tax=Termitidicoccus mucosus TaxID=1184151 RepID=A0A178IK83_9BACT|nr:preprotein translocase subunit SecG [Opitutaceae bacterium TSB47]